MGGSAAEDLDWGPEGSLTRFIADENKKVTKAMLHSGWRPADLLDVQHEWWVRQKKDRYEKACILVLQAHVRFAGKVQLDVQDKKSRPQSTQKPRRLLPVRFYRPYPMRPAPRRPQPVTGRGSRTIQTPGNCTRA
ncbi:hypothetical protein chiPu_0031020, partial [Chiloscyllium punctatum]|nr:hypothetical protein [Chiloscyllium punctatum]